MDYKKRVEKIINKFINTDEYIEIEIENKIENLLKENIENIKKIDVFYVPNENKFKIRMIIFLDKNNDPLKFFYEFENEFLINNKRKIILKKILEDG